jgi:hypothetical protein
LLSERRSYRRTNHGSEATLSWSAAISMTIPERSETLDQNVDPDARRLRRTGVAARRAARRRAAPSAG